MKESEAVAITRQLLALFPRDAIEPESAAAFAKEIALLVNAELGMQAAHECARSFDHFPSIHQFRIVYGSVHRSQPRPAIEATDIPPSEREEVGKLFAETLHRMEMPTEDEVPGGVEVDDLGKGTCSDCGHEGNTWTYGESHRPLCSKCIRARLRALVASAR